jgi:hypothetical protein
MQNKIFELLQKVKIICGSALSCKKMKRACGVILRKHALHNGRTIRAVLAAVEENIYQTHTVYMYGIVLPHL